MNWDVLNFVVGLYLLLGSLVISTKDFVSALFFKGIPGVFGVLLVLRYLSLIGVL